MAKLKDHKKIESPEQLKINGKTPKTLCKKVRLTNGFRLVRAYKRKHKIK